MSTFAKILKVAALVAPTLLLPAQAGAGGLGRPNIGGARPIGLGGAYVAVAEDPSAIWHNPAGLAQETRWQALLGLEIAKPKFVHEPADGQCGNDPATNAPRVNCAKVESVGGPAIVPLAGASTRFAAADGAEPSRLAVGLAVYNSYGGTVEFDREKLKTIGSEGGVIKSRLALLEAAPSVAYRVNEQLFLGASFRIGIGLFNAESAARGDRSSAKLDSSGVGVGYTLGAMLRPIPEVRIGVVYHSQLTVEPGGQASIERTPGSAPLDSDVKTPVAWPQSAVGGVSVKPIDRLLLSSQVEWVNWASFQAIAPQFQRDRSLDVLARYDNNLKDSWTAHFGIEYWLLADRKGTSAAARFGYARDASAIPAPSLERHSQDADRNVFGGGGTLGLGKLNIDFAFEAVLGSERKVACGPDRTTGRQTDVCADVLPERRASAPGTFSAKIFIGQLTARLLF